MAAQAATRGGADFLLALNAGRMRSMGEPSIASLLALRNTNVFVPAFAQAEIRPRTHLPVYVGFAACDPRLDLAGYLSRLEEAGFEGVTNFPTAVLLDGAYRQFLEASGWGFGRELAVLEAAAARGFATLAYVHTREEARRAALAGVGIVNADLGWNTGGALGVNTHLRLDEAAEMAAASPKRHATSCPTCCAWSKVARSCGRTMRTRCAAPRDRRLCRRLHDRPGAAGSCDGTGYIRIQDGRSLAPHDMRAGAAARPRDVAVTALRRYVGHPASRAAFDRAAAAEMPVLISGPPGSGRRDLARHLHNAGGRRSKRLAWVTCGPDAALELFGAEPGGAPGVTRRRVGWLELARGSTLVLDGVGALGPALLRLLSAALESGAFRRLGGSEALPFDVRLIGVADLSTEFLSGSVAVKLPALAEHIDDLPGLVRRIKAEIAPFGGRAGCVDLPGPDGAPMA